MNSNKSLYNVLGIEPDASELEIRKAYQTLALKSHPDKQLKESSEFIAIVNAYNVLKDPSTRKQYDQKVGLVDYKGIGILDTIDLNDMEEINDEEWTYPCRCSGTYTLSIDNMENSVNIVHCDSCSLRIRVLYSVVDSDEAETIPKS